MGYEDARKLALSTLRFQQSPNDPILSLDPVPNVGSRNNGSPSLRFEDDKVEHDCSRTTIPR